ncbi:MAG: hypothetical protein FIA92_02870 [Chloroflexi bacterium]|nr:hypothetical protein [Chloroflexota bacterium]
MDSPSTLLPGAAGPDRGGIRTTSLVVLAFGVAFGYLEAAVVVYLRAVIETGAVLPAQDPATLGTFEAVEILRELATVAMIATVGWLAGRSRLERLAWSAVVFGTWDIVYYLGLRWTIGWPPALDTWDVLFLIPMAWVGPVWAPMAVSAALIGVGLAAARRLRAGGSLRIGPTEIAGGLVGGALVIVSFLVDSERFLAGDLAPWSGWPLFLGGMVVAGLAAIRAFVVAGQRALATAPR